MYAERTCVYTCTCRWCIDCVCPAGARQDVPSDAGGHRAEAPPGGGGQEAAGGDAPAGDREKREVLVSYITTRLLGRSYRLASLSSMYGCILTTYMMYTSTHLQVARKLHWSSPTFCTCVTYKRVDAQTQIFAPFVVCLSTHCCCAMMSR